MSHTRVCRAHDQMIRERAREIKEAPERGRFYKRKALSKYEREAIREQFEEVGIAA